MSFILRWIRSFVGGKTEIGLILSAIMLLLFIFADIPWLNEAEEVLKVLGFIGAATGTALLGRIENQKGFLSALKTLFNYKKQKTT